MKAHPALSHSLNVKNERTECDPSHLAGNFFKLKFVYKFFIKYFFYLFSTFSILKKFFSFLLLKIL